MISLRAPLSDVAVGSRVVVNVRAMCVSDRRAIEGGACDDCSGAAEGLLTWRSGPVALPEPRRDQSLWVGRSSDRNPGCQGWRYIAAFF